MPSAQISCLATQRIHKVTRLTPSSVYTDGCDAAQHQRGLWGDVLTVSTAVQENARSSVHKMSARRTRSNSLRHRGRAMNLVLRHHNCLGQHWLAESTHSWCGGKHTRVIPGSACTLPVDTNVLCETINDCRVKCSVVKTQMQCVLREDRVIPLRQTTQF